MAPHSDTRDGPVVQAGRRAIEDGNVNRVQFWVPQDAEEDVNTVYSFYESVGLPITLADIGLVNANREKLMIVAEMTCAPHQPIHHEGENITPERVLKAMLAADAIGKARRGSGY
jgi:glycerol dehydrogenase-like iron-containing ADH family enzyme